jgi:hypothetical protein
MSISRVKFDFYQNSCISIDSFDISCSSSSIPTKESILHRRIIIGVDDSAIIVKRQKVEKIDERKLKKTQLAHQRYHTSPT